MTNPARSKDQKKAIWFFILFLGAELQLFSQGKVTVVKDSLFSPSVNAYMKFNAVLPANYSVTDERFTTIYLLHGYAGDYNDWVTHTALVRYAKDYNFIIITPDGKNSWYTNSPELKNSNYEDYIVKDLIPYVDKKYKTLNTRHGRAVAGLSMGGYGAIKLALKYPFVFFYAASLSGALQFPKDLENVSGDLHESLKSAFGEKKSDHWSRNDVFSLVDSVSNTNMPYLYLAVGKDDLLPGIIESNRSFIEKLRRKGALYEYHETPGGHSWVFWDKEIANVLRRFSNFDALKP